MLEAIRPEALEMGDTAILEVDWILLLLKIETLLEFRVLVLVEPELICGELELVGAGLVLICAEP